VNGANPLVPAGVAWVVAAVLAVVVIVYLGFLLRFERWKARYAREIRRDAVDRSQAVTVGKVTEQLTPFLPQFEWNPKDARFVGSPVDLIVFDGLNDGELRQVLFVEVKTGSSSLNVRERQVRDAIEARRVGWRELRLPG
jgi:predicted Holliday junction resolvase-like endonuclease